MPATIVKRYLRDAALFLFAGAVICLPLPASPQVAGKVAVKPPDISEIVSRMVQLNAERARELQSFQGRRTYTLVYKGFPGSLRAQMVVNMTYIAPDTKNFTIVSQTGPKFLQDQVLVRLIKIEANAQKSKIRKKVDLNTDNYTFSDLVYTPASDGCSYRLSVEPKTASKYLYRGLIWIDSTDYAVCRLSVQPAKNPSFWIKSTKISHSYEKVGSFWLPLKNTSVSAVRLGGIATLTIEYQDYKILETAPPNPGPK
ncbi:MAG: hypothetical protein ACYDC6_10405 [Acidobacteriaceae bacterium]